jgi:phosphopantetheine adenylyltransferase
MFTQEKIRLYVFGFLAFCVFSSKNIIIYNEETLVALSFFSFILFVSRYFGTTIKESLNERSELIQHELQNFLNIKEQSFTELLIEHKKVSAIVNTLKGLNVFTNTELVSLKINNQKALKNVFIEQIETKLKTLAFSKLMLQQKLQFLLSENVLLNVLLASQQTQSEKLKMGPRQPVVAQKTIQHAIQLLVANKKK